MILLHRNNKALWTPSLPPFRFANMKPQFLLLALAAFLCSTARAADSKPNFVVVFTDDQGYGDVGCFGSTTIRTPNLDRMAKEGRKSSME